jgi:hypothetical protein
MSFPGEASELNVFVSCGKNGTTNDGLRAPGQEIVSHQFSAGSFRICGCWRLPRHQWRSILVALITTALDRWRKIHDF